MMHEPSSGSQWHVALDKSQWSPTRFASSIRIDEFPILLMSTTPVKFDRPPVAEVVCSVAFSVPRPIRTVDIGCFWQGVSDKFPEVEEVAPTRVVVEPLSGESVARLGVDVQEIPPLRRTWLRASDQRTLLQIQDDRFMFNWRKLPGDVDGAYPGNDWVQTEFWKHWTAFDKFLTSLPDVGQPTILQLEHTYINAISDVDQLSSDLGAVLVDHQRSNHAGRFLPAPEGFKWISSYLLPSNTGRLHVVAQSAKLTSSGAPIVRLELTSRGLPMSTDMRELVAWFKVSHDWITRGFADITRPDAHTELWGRVS